jgi:hypothetical protein
MYSRQFTQYILGLVFLVSSSFALSNTEFTYNVIDGGIVVTGCVDECSSDLVIPEEIDGLTVIGIGSSAFENLAIESLILPDSLEAIDSYAFRFNSLTSISIPNNLSNISVSVFSYNKLTSLVIPNNVISIGIAAFSENELTELVLGQGLESIGSYAFADNELTTISIPNNLTSIGEGAFRYNQLTSLNIPDNVTSIGYEAFASNQITSLQLSENLEYVGLSAFRENLITQVTIPNNFTHIPNGIFSQNQLTSLIIPDSVATIDGWSIDQNQLTNLTFGVGIETIESNAFFQHGAINTVRFYGDRPQIMENAFYSQYIYYCSETQGWPGAPIGGVTPQLDDVCDTSMAGLLDTDNDGVIDSEDAFPFDSSETIDTDLDGIGNIADWDDDNDGSHDIHDEAPLDETIGGLDFTYEIYNNEIMINGCSVICPTEITIPEMIGSYSVTVIGDDAFRDAGINSISLPNTITEIRPGAFSGNPGQSSSGFRYLILSDRVAILGCTLSCPSELIIPETIMSYPVTIVESNSFEYSQINAVQLPSSLEVIADGAFYDNQITNLIIPSNIEIIGSGAFEYNPLTNVSFLGNLPDEIGEYVFSGNDTLGHNIFYCSGATGWPGDTFEGVSAQEDESCNIINDQSGITHYSTFDIDQNGSFDALTDGLILLRYAFGLTGDNLINGVISPDANRTSAADIEAYIESHMP